MVQASLCATMVWFGVMQLWGGGLVWPSKAVQASGNAGDFRSITYQYEAKTLLAKPGGKSGAASTPNHISAKDAQQQGAQEELAESDGKDSGNKPDHASEDNSATVGLGAGGVGAGSATTSGPGAGDVGAGSERSAGDESGDAKPEEGKKGATAADGQASREESKVVYLTFDDGPSQHTPEVLRILKREGVSATFFLLGEQVERQSELVKQIAGDGHAIGNHTYNHVYKELYGSFRNFADQIMRTDDAIYAASGIRTTLVRAPGGTYSNFDGGYFEAMKAAGYQVHDWNVDSGDSKRIGVPASEIIANIRGSKVANALNVLMHDSAGHAETVKALPDIISYYKNLGYTFATLNEKIEPMQFQLAGQSKWSRAAVTEADKTRLVQFAANLDRAGQPSNRPEPALVIHRGDNKLELQASEYKLVNDSIRVPLGKLSEWLGGTAELDKEQGVVEVTLDGRQWFWLADGLPSDQDDPSQLDVPIRATLAQFGMDIESYVYTKEQREVWIGA
jgi:peptidoglycan/xylan/chitin deacetylase (PgdA/CDA1 family)